MGTMEGVPRVVSRVYGGARDCDEFEGGGKGVVMQELGV